MFEPDHATSFRPTAAAAARAGAGFSSLERTVIGLARNEVDEGRWRSSAPRHSLPSRWLRRIGRVLTGRRSPDALADERLEALRRFVALVRRQDRRAARVAEMLRAHGYRPDQLAAIESLALA